MRKEPEITYTDKITHAVNFLSPFLKDIPETGIILGTGLGSLVNDIEPIKEIPYEDIPYFPLSTVTSHHGKLIIGKWGTKTILAMKGRFHYYEGYSMKEVTFPIRILRKLGVLNLLISNASGGLNPVQKVGDILLIQDHIDLFPENPLRGPNLGQFGDRFPDMSQAYFPTFIEWALEIAREKDIPIHQGVYAGVQGPNLETPAEYRYLRILGADAVGMSTVPEVQVAVHSGMRVFALSAITDLGSPGNIKKIDLNDVLRAAAKAEPAMREIINGILNKLYPS
ncbi:purine-nucleoside phosphorylase [Cyclobacterium jeungdonense]|uniref:Purine nucleoside phosphorylase n=1 Tax=Cyclobacterium jeungdonense TaxID=708087 RepID=A0ABT8C4B8_9BACT|nr:purine-nucleoside phosphorylase [Cyclobacterium jeungdonense]MDN3686458.1 purine-nucleoside phosphorylase [Cyclobacterium jeungdonense]